MPKDSYKINMQPIVNPEKIVGFDRSKKVLEKALNSGISLAFDDVTLIPNYANFRLNEIDTTTDFSRNVKLKIPIVSAAMDTVTEHKMAIEIAKYGGLGIIHRNLDSEMQAHQVKLVKRYLNGLIEQPAWVRSRETLDEIRQRFGKDEERRFHSFPIINEESKLIGMLGEKSFKFGEPHQTAEEIAITEMITAKEETTTEEAYQIMKENRIGALPLTNESYDLKGLYVFSDVKRIIKGSGNYNLDKKGRLKVGAAIGVLDDAFERLEKLIETGVDVIVIDTAHADSLDVLETLERIKKEYSRGDRIDIVVGNISNGKAVKRLVDAGADGIKVGQGPGSICTTRIIAGTGRAQISAIYSCSKEAEKYNIPICADGGLRYSGDITKSIAAGASSVMLGNMLAGTEESPGKNEFHKGRMWKSYRGMGSLGAMQEYKGSRERYGQKNTTKLVPEGVEGLQPYKGFLKDIIGQYIGGLRSGMGYAGTKTIEELKLRGDFDRITPAAREESRPHDILITKGAPNYQITDEENGYE